MKRKDRRGRIHKGLACCPRCRGQQTGRSFTLAGDEHRRLAADGGDRAFGYITRDAKSR